jgi:hypothetical protein
MLRWIAAMCVVGLVPVTPARAKDRVEVGVLELTSPAPIFLGVEPELVYFRAAASLP